MCALKKRSKAKVDHEALAALVIQAGVVFLLLEMRFRLRKPDSTGRYWRPWNGGGRGYMVLWLLFQACAGAPMLIAYLIAGWLGLVAILLVGIVLSWLIWDPNRLKRQLSEEE